MNDWKPLEGPQTEFLSRPEDEVLFGGSKGPGKSEALVAEALRQIEHPQYKALIVRRTFPRLAELIDRSHRIYSKAGGTYRSAEHTWVFPSGSRIRFGSCQYEKDKENYQGHEYAYIGFDQLEEFTETQYLYIAGANRSSIAGMRVYIRASANPGGIGHAWVKKRFIDNKEPNKQYVVTYELPNNLGFVSRSFTFIPSTVFDNPILLKANPQYLTNLMQLPERMRKAMLYGDWNSFEGQYFSEFDEAIHVIKPFEIPAHWNRFRCLDWGHTDPACCLWIASDEQGNLFVYRELYQTGLTYLGLAQQIIARNRDDRIAYTVADPSIWRKEGGTGETGEIMMSRGGVTLMKADNDRVNGWMRIREYLKGADGKIRLFITEDCPNLIRTLPSLIHSEKKPEDAADGSEDHAPDALRYGVMSRPRPTKVDAPFLIRSYDQRVQDFQEKRRRRFAKTQSGNWDSTLGGNW